MRDINELYQGTQAECMKQCLRLKYTKKECEEQWCAERHVTVHMREGSDCGCSKKSKETADEEEFEMQLKNKKKLTESLIKKFRFRS